MNSYTNRVIIHIDGDAFFASVEQAKNYRLKGKPVITGGERFIAAAMSYEAKARGVTRGMPIQDIRRVCPEAIIVSSDYITYTIFARRMYNIVRRYTPYVEEYSIDECFADLTGLDQVFGMSYVEIGKKIKAELEQKLGITFGVGMSSSKVLAKVASKHKKPAGFTVIGTQFGCEHLDVHQQHKDSEGRCTADGIERNRFLENTPIERVWGIGTATTKLLRSNGVMTALDFANLSPGQMSALSIAKPYREIQQELNGVSVIGVHSAPRDPAKSIMCTRTFSPPSREVDVVFSHLSKNIEEGCERLRYEGLYTTLCSIYIKSQDFRYYRREYFFDEATNDAMTIISRIFQDIDTLFKSHLVYRATGISFYKLISREEIIKKPRSLFDSLVVPVKATSLLEQGQSQMVNIFDKVDVLNRKYGEHTVMLGSSLRAVLAYRTKNAQKNAFIPKNSQKNLSRNLSKFKNKTWSIPVVGTVKG